MSTENVVNEVMTDPQDAPNMHSTDWVIVNGAITKTEQPRESGNSKTGLTKTLYRHPSDKMIAGVCGGIAEFFGWDAALIRILWVVLTLATGGGGFLAYLALWMLLPVGTVSQGQQRAAAIELNQRNLRRAAYALIVFGSLWFLANVGILPRLVGAAWSVVSVVFWPALLIGAGYLLLRSSSNRNWREDFSDAGRRLRSRVNGKAPSKDEMKDGLKSARNHIPLKRSREDRIFMGVCGGIGRRLGIDANLVRLIWAAFSVGSIGMGVLIYIAIGLLLPEESDEDIIAAMVEPQDVQVVDGSVSG